LYGGISGHILSVVKNLVRFENHIPVFILPVNSKMKSILDTINRAKQFLELDTLKVTQIPYRYYKEIPPRCRGIYILEDELQRPIYVGKGWIRTRQMSHWPKAHGVTKSYHTDPKGWQYLREHNELTPTEWTIYYIEVEKETAISALEGSLIHILQPLANDETYRDNNTNEQTQ
jgi:hypothetical protein